METSKRVQIFSVIAAVLFVMVAMTAGYRRIGVPPVVIVGGSSLVALVLWIKTYLWRPLDPAIILPGFLLTVAALEVHMIEEYLTGFTHFIFPLLKPAIQPELVGSLSQAVSNGRFVGDMHNYWVKTTGVYYFPGMYTAILPMIPGIYTIRRVIMGKALSTTQGAAK